MAKANNLAYDYSVYENLPQKQPEKRIQVKKNTADIHTVSAVKSFIVAVAALCLLCAILYGKVQMSQMYGESAKLTKELDSINTANVSAQTELESKTSLQSIEDYAVNTLGLQKLEGNQKDYIQVQKENKIEVVEEDDNVFVSIKNWVKGALEYIGA